MTFGERFLQLRTQSGISRDTFAKILGVTNGTITNYEKGKREPGIQKLKDMADTLGVSIDVLVGREEPQTDGERGRTKPVTAGDMAIQKALVGASEREKEKIARMIKFLRIEFFE